MMWRSKITQDYDLERKKILHEKLSSLDFTELSTSGGMGVFTTKYKKEEKELEVIDQVPEIVIQSTERDLLAVVISELPFQVERPRETN